MKIIKPHQITDSMMLGSSIGEDDYPAWVSGATYALGDRVIRTQTHCIYERLSAGSSAIAPELDAATWLYVGPTNKWAAFDNVVGTTSSGPSPLSFVIRTGSTDSLALFELTGRTAQVVMKDVTDGTVVYDRTLDLDATDIESFYGWFFHSDFSQRADIVLTDLPSQFANAELTVTIAATSGDTAVGVLKPGLAADLGQTQSGATVSITDYSRKERDDFGNVVVVERAYSKKANFSLLTTLSSFNRIYRTLADLRATPCVYIGTEADGYEPLLIYGFFRDFSIDVQYPKHHLCSLEIEGLI
jgi:hypothetical protein